MGKIYTPEFRRKAVELYRLDDEMTYAQIARDMGCSSEAVRNWVEQADIDDGLAGLGDVVRHVTNCDRSADVVVDDVRRFGVAMTWLTHRPSIDDAPHRQGQFLLV